MELRAEIHVASDLVADICGPCAVQEEGITCQDSDRIPIQTGEPAHDTPAPIMSDLEKATRIYTCFNNLPRLVRRLTVCWHNREQALLPSHWRVTTHDSLRKFVHR